MPYFRLILIVILITILGGCGQTPQTITQNTPVPGKQGQPQPQGTVFEQQQDNTPVIFTGLTPTSTHPIISPIATPALSLTPTVIAATPAVDCPQPRDPRVLMTVDQTTIHAGETLTISPSLEGFAQPVNASLAVNDEYIAKVGWNSDQSSVGGTVANVEVSSNPNAASPQFLVRALAPGNISLQVSGYGDTGVCTVVEGQCNCYTTHQSFASEKITVEILPAQTPAPTVTPTFTATSTPQPFQFTPTAWHASGNPALVHFRGTIRDEAGNPVNGYSVLVDNGSWRTISHPSGASHHYPHIVDGEWDVVLANPRSGVGWWTLTVVRYECPNFEEKFDAQCQHFTRLSEDVKVEVKYPDSTIIWADWTCQRDCDQGLYTQAYRRP